jgi:hypothetical protein
LRQSRGAPRLIVSCKARAGGWSDAAQRWLPQGEARLRAGRNTLRFARDNYFPHIRAFRLVPE